MKLLLSIVGPTATGKTQFLLQLIKVLQKDGLGAKNIDVISADSRQVYTGMEIGTGVDLPNVQEQESEFSHVRFFGVSLLNPDEEWSLTHFLNLAEEKILSAWKEDHLPIVIGGTGLYHQHLFAHDPQATVRPNSQIRTRAGKLSVEELQEWLSKVDHEKLQTMNDSDRQNPRRLVRAIEMAEFSISQLSQKISPSPEFFHLTIGLTDKLEHLQEKIQARVKERLNTGMLDEVQRLMAQYSDEQWKNLPALSATGYKEVRAYLEDQLTKEQMIELWSRREFQYAKRQLTWWKKYGTSSDEDRKKTLWFNVSEDNWQDAAFSAILQAYQYSQTVL